KKNILIKVKKEENELNSDEAGNDGKVPNASIPLLLYIIRSFPLFAIHRLDWSILHPMIRANDIDIQDLKNVLNDSTKQGQSKRGVICGCIESEYAQIESQLEWDIVADLNMKSVIVKTHSYNKQQQDIAAQRRELSLKRNRNKKKDEDEEEISDYENEFSDEFVESSSGDDDDDDEEENENEEELNEKKFLKAQKKHRKVLLQQQRLQERLTQQQKPRLPHQTFEITPYHKEVMNIIQEYCNDDEDEEVEDDEDGEEGQTKKSKLKKKNKEEEKEKKKERRRNDEIKKNKELIQKLTQLNQRIVKDKIEDIRLKIIQRANEKSNGNKEKYRRLSEFTTRNVFSVLRPVQQLSSSQGDNSNASNRSLKLSAANKQLLFATCRFLVDVNRAE
ncbi:MAG: hypothetical protein EZS28_027496, partial [Streblomastix strix]